MLIFVKKDTPEAAIRSLVIQLSRQGIGTARADSAGRTMLTLVGETWTLDEQRLLALPYVAEVKRLTPVWRLASRQTHPEDTVVSAGDAQIGKGFCLMAGPCAVESALQMQGVARAVKAAGGLVLRGGAYKPRTSPYAFRASARLRWSCWPRPEGKWDCPPCRRSPTRPSCPSLSRWTCYRWARGTCRITSCCVPWVSSQSQCC